MDVTTIVDALTAEERAALLEALLAAGEEPGTEADELEGRGCCGGGHRHRVMRRRRAMMAEMSRMCCGAE